VQAGKYKFLAFAFAAVLLVLPAAFPQKAFADGLFQENLPPASIGDRDASLFVKINPPILTSDTQQDAFMQFRLFDARNNETIKFTTFIITVSKGTDPKARPLFTEVFHTESGLLTLKIQPEDTERVRVLGTQEPYLLSWMADPGGTVNLRGPILLEGGLYHFNIELLTVDSIRTPFAPGTAPVYDTYLSVGDVVTQDVVHEGETYPTTVISYYDRVEDFSFDSDELQYSWAMPFNWNVTRIEDAPNIFVHEEIKVPKSLAGIGDATAFDSSVNGIPISGRMLAVDPFSSETELTLHFLLNKNDILNLAGQVPEDASEMTFAFSPAAGSGEQTSGEIASDTGGVHVKLQWDPRQMSANNEETLNLEFIDAFSGEKLTSDVTYDLRIIDGEGEQVYEVTDQVAEGGTDSQQMTFPADASYRIEVEVKAITADGQTPDLTRNGVARGIVVVPEFPAGAMLAIAGVLGAAVAAARLMRRK
jgi:hypothetical protein